MGRLYPRVVDACGKIDVSVGDWRLVDIKFALLTDTRAPKAEIGTVIDIATPADGQGRRQKTTKLSLKNFSCIIRMLASALQRVVKISQPLSID